MRNFQFIVFFGIVIAVFSLLNWYIYSKGIQVFPQGTGARTGFRWIFIFLAASYPVARILERVWLSPVSDIFTWIGSFWLAAFFYFLLISLVVDFIRLINLPFGFLPELTRTAGFKQVFFWLSCSIVTIALIGGFINSRFPRTKILELDIPKKRGAIKELRIAYASDIHLGTVIGPRRVKAFVKRMNGLKPDIILLGGDVVDEDLAPVIRNNLGDSLKKLSAPMGVFAITGNHEYIGGAEAACRYLADHGIKMIRDSAVLVAESFYLIGREDRDRPRFIGKPRVPVDRLMENIDAGKPVIMLDHQPFELDRKEELGIDLTLSGHTHHGQMFPLNYLTKAIYEESWGYKKKGNTHAYVSSGYGGWGPPVRIGNRPEIVLISLHFAQ
jgi:predicted MPP superfamily phosphohydrolase